MSFPNNISKNAIKVYYIADIEFKTTKRVLSLNLNQWKANLPKTLKEWSIETICKNWAENPLVNELPLLSDITVLIDILPTDLPLTLTVINIAYDHYWLRSFKDRWPKKPPLGRNFSEVEDLLQEKKEVKNMSFSTTPDGDENRSAETPVITKSSKSNSRKSTKSSIMSSEMNFDTNGNRFVRKTWKELYLELHLKEYLESLEPENYDPEKIKEITNLCKNYVSSLTLSELRAPTKTEVPDHIPLNTILSNLDRLTELSLCFKQTCVGEKFSWHIFNTTMIDVKNLAKGLEQTKLQILRIQNSDINCVKVKMLLKALAKNDSLSELEFSHCKIADHGTTAIAKFVERHENLKCLVLINNFIGASGAKSLAYALSLNCKLQTLNLRLNMIRSKGGRYLTQSLMKGGKDLRNLMMAGCGLVGENIEIGEMLRYNTTLKELDISNNRCGEDVGQVILDGLKYNKTLTRLDIRRCNFTSDTEWKILEIIKENRSRRIPERPKTRQENKEDLVQQIFTDDFIEEFDTVLDE